MLKGELIGYINACNIEIKRIEREREGYCNALLDLICPYKIGDITDAKGYSFNGKQCRITDRKIELNTFNNSLGYQVFGIVLKKDGTDSRNRVEWCKYNIV